MSWCPQCKTEYVDTIASCPDCGTALVADLTLEEHIAEDLVLVYNAPDQTTAELVVATLEAAGIPAVLQHDTLGPGAGLMPYLGVAWNRGVAVPAAYEQEALAILQAAPPTEEELIAEELEDPVTLEEAEAAVRDV